MAPNRRDFLKGSATAAGALAVGAGGLAAPALAQNRWAPTMEPILGYPDPRVIIMTPHTPSLRQGIAKVEQLATGFNFVEGPVWFGNHRFLVFSDLGNNKLMKWDERTGETTVYSENANHTNGNTKDRQGRLISCQQLLRRVVRFEHDGSETVIADSFEGKPLNSPNDVCVKSDGTIWFTDPPNGITNDYEGRRADQEQANTNVFRVDPETGDITAVITDIRPNGICFNHDETILYVTRSQAVPTRVMAYDVVENGTAVTNGRVFIEHENSSVDGMRCDWNGNLWCSWGAGPGESGVRVFSPTAEPLLQVELPERAANICFGGPVGNRIFMTAQQSVYALYVGTRGATY